MKYINIRSNATKFEFVFYFTYTFQHFFFNQNKDNSLISTVKKEKKTANILNLTFCLFYFQYYFM